MDVSHVGYGQEEEAREDGYPADESSIDNSSGTEYLYSPSDSDDDNDVFDSDDDDDDDLDGSGAYPTLKSH